MMPHMGCVSSPDCSWGPVVLAAVYNLYQTVWGALLARGVDSRCNWRGGVGESEWQTVAP